MQNSLLSITMRSLIVEVSREYKAEYPFKEEVRSMGVVQSMLSKESQEEHFFRVKDGRLVMVEKKHVLLLQEFYPTLQVLLLIRMY